MSNSTQKYKDKYCECIDRLLDYCRKSFADKEIGTDKQSLSVPSISGGGGIRTHGTLPHSGFQVPHQNNVNPCNNKHLQNQQNQTATKTAHDNQTLAPELESLIEKWDGLPEHIKQTIKILLDSIH